MFDYEERAHEKGFSIIIGVDEAGRGPLAGPVVAAAVFLKSKEFDSSIKDSKKISPLKRDKAYQEIFEKAYVGVGIISESTIDNINILQASFLAMKEAVSNLIRNLPEEITKDIRFKDNVVLLIDGNRFDLNMPYAVKTIVEGDSKVFSISCASIIAKVTRDRMMLEYDEKYPEYGFKKHKGYPTKAHKEALKIHGPSKIHRKTFKY